MDETDMDMDIDSQLLAPNIGGSKMSRAEKSRLAAKNRRDKEGIAMQALMDELPVSDEILNKMDKTSIIRLAICYIRIKHYVQKDMLTLTANGNFNGRHGNKLKPPLAITTENKNKDPVFDACIEDGLMMLEALNGFLIFITKKGKVQFVSKTVEDHLGLKQVHMIGKSVTDFIHNADHAELVKQFGKVSTNGKLAITEHEGFVSYAEEDRKVFYLRMKYSLPKPGSKAKNEGYMLVQWSGKIKKHQSSKTGKMTTDGLLCICRPMQTTSILEIRMDGNMFMSRHDLKMTFTFCDTRILTLIGYEPNEVVGKTAYYFHNPLDAPRVSDCHSKLIVKGTSVSKYYRFLGKNSDWVWLQTRATIIYNTSNKPQYIVCMNYVISEEEGERFLMLEEQKQATLTLPDNHDDFPIIFCGKQNSACGGPKLVEIPSSDDDDDDDDIGKSPPEPQMTVNHTPEQQGQKRLCIRIPPPKQQPAPIQPPRHQADFVTTTRTQTSNQSPLNQLNQTTLNQQTINKPTLSQIPLVESTLSQPTFIQTSLCQAGPVINDSAYSVVSQSQQFQPDLNLQLDVKPSNFGDNDVRTSEPVANGFLQDLNPDVIPSVSMATQIYPGLQPSPGNYSNTPSPASSSNTSSPPYSRKIYPDGQNNESAQNIAYDTSQGSLSDGGYESATSPYSSTNTASPLQNVDLLQDTESSHSIIQGDNTFLGIGYSSSPPVSVGNPEVTRANVQYSRDTLNTDGLGMDMLDELLKSFNQDGGCGNIEFPFSAVGNIANSNTGPLISNVEPMNVYSPSPERPDSRSNDRPFLRSLLNMPENDIPKTPIMVKEFSFHANVESPSAESSSNGFSPRSDMYDSDSQQSGYGPLNQNRNVTNFKNIANKGISRENSASMEGYQKMEITDVPQDISDIALNFLENLTDGQTLSDLGSDILMDTGDDSDFSKFVSSILTQTDAPQPQYAISNMANKSGSGGVNNKTQSRPQFPKVVVTQSAQGKQAGNRFSVPQVPRNKLGAQCAPKQPQYSSSNNSSFTSLHVDHGYHQTKGTKNQFSKVRSPNGTAPSSRVNGQMNGGNLRFPYQGQKTCRGQSKETMSQLEKHLRGWGRDATTPDHGSSVRNGQPKPFLEQLLTGELTKDKYIEMEKERCRYMKGINHS